MSLNKYKIKIKKALKSGSKEDIDQAMSAYWQAKEKEVTDKDIEKIAQEIFFE